MANVHWLDVFSDIHSTFLPPKFSDHSAGLLSCQSILSWKKGLSKFFNFGLEIKNFFQWFKRSGVLLVSMR